MTKKFIFFPKPPRLVKQRDLNTTDSIVVESCFMKLQLRNKPAHHMFPNESKCYCSSDTRLTQTLLLVKILMFFFFFYNSFIDPSVNLTKYGPSLLSSNLTFFIRSSCLSPLDLSKCEERLIQQRGYTPQDIEALLQVRKSLDAAGEVGVDIHDLCQTHTHLEEQQSGYTHSLQQYMKVLTFTMKISLSLNSAKKTTTLIGFGCSQ